jgi:hypothetical protein
MEIPTCNYTIDNKEYYVKTITNDNYIPIVFGFIIGLSSIGLLTGIYNANTEYKQQNKNKIKIVLLIILILIFLSLLVFSSYKVGIYNIKDLSVTYNSNELLLPCYSKYTKKIYGSKNIIFDESFNVINLNASSSNTPKLTLSVRNNKSAEETIITPYNTRSSAISSTTTGNVTPGSASVVSDGSSASSLGNLITFRNNSTPPSSSIKTTNTQQASQNSNGTNSNEAVSPVQDGQSYIVTGKN